MEAGKERGKRRHGEGWNGTRCASLWIALHMPQITAEGLGPDLRGQREALQDFVQHVADNAIEVSLNPLGSHPTPWRNNALHIDDASTVHHVQHGEGVASNVNNKFIQAIAMGA